MVLGRPAVGVGMGTGTGTGMGVSVSVGVGEVARPGSGPPRHTWDAPHGELACVPATFTAQW